MFKSISTLWIFYKKIIIPTLIFSLLASCLSSFNIENFGLSFLLISPVLHYFIYELRFKNEYYFYANLGFSRSFLWGFTISVCVIVKIITGIL